MEHRGDGHINIINAHPPLARSTRERNRHTQGMQHNLALTEINPFGIACGPRRVKSGRADIFAEVRRVETARRGAQQGLVLAIKRVDGCLIVLGSGIAKANNILNCRGLSFKPLKQRSKVIMHEQRGVLGMVNRVEDLLRCQAYVDSMQHSADHGHREKALQVAMTIPIHHCDRIAGAYSQRLKSAREALDPIEKIRVAKAQIVPVANLLSRVLGRQP